LAHDWQIADTLLNQLGPHTMVLADKAYDADRIRQLIRDRGATPNIQEQPALETLLQQAALPRA
jgi:IS5 family transposase